MVSPTDFSDDEIGGQILNIFARNGVRPGGTLRRNHFTEVRDAHFQRGLNKAVENRWLTIKPHNRYTYELTEAGFAAGAKNYPSADLPR